MLRENRLSGHLDSSAHWLGKLTHLDLAANKFSSLQLEAGMYGGHAREPQCPFCTCKMKVKLGIAV